MTSAPRTLRHFLLLAGLLLAAATAGLANNIQVTGTSLGNRNTGNDTRPITFTVTWENSWKTTVNRDAAWIFVKYRKSGTATWHHAMLASGGHSAGNNRTLETGWNDAGDRVMGVFLHESTDHNMTTVSSTVTLIWNYAQNTERVLDDDDEVEVRVYAVEMVHVPGGASHRVGDGGASTKSFRSARAGRPYDVTLAGQGANITDLFHPVSLLDHDSTHTTADVATHSMNYQLPAGDNRFALVTVMTKDRMVSSVTIDGTPLTLVASENQYNNIRVFLYRFFPNASHHNKELRATLASKSNGGFIISVSTFGNVSQTEPIGFVDSIFQDNQANPTETGIQWSKADLIFGTIGTEKASINGFPSGTQVIMNTPQISDIFGGICLKQPSATPTETLAYTIGKSDKKSVMVTAVLQHHQTGGFSLNASGGLDNNSNFPTGYNHFYCMKYEVTQAQYAAFLNTLTIAQQTERTATPPGSSPGTGALSSLNDYRNGIDVMTSAGQFPAVYACNLDGNGTYNDPEADGMPLACNYLHWDDLAAWLDWAALRPMTELEFEKACRGNGNVAYKHPWGNTDGSGVTGSSFTNLGKTSEQLVTSSDANYNIGNAFQGPTRVGVFARDANNANYNGKKTRLHSGASRMGILDLAGNVWEQMVTIVTSEGRSFDGSHGDGSLGANGEHHWPSLSPSAGTGSRGGGWTSTASSDIHVSDRSKADYVPAARDKAYGGRGVRSTTSN